MKELLEKWKEYVDYCLRKQIHVPRKSWFGFTKDVDVYNYEIPTFEGFMDWLERNTND